MTQAPARTNQARAIKPLKELLDSPAYAGRIKQILNERAPQFCASLVQVAQAPSLRDCEPHSIIASAMTAATLDLPIEKDLGLAHIVPYKSGGVKSAQFQMG